MTRFSQMSCSQRIQNLLDYVDMQSGQISIRPLSGDPDGESECMISFLNEDVIATGHTPEEAQLEALKMLERHLPDRMDFEAKAPAALNFLREYEAGH